MVTRAEARCRRGSAKRSHADWLKRTKPARTNQRACAPTPPPLPPKANGLIVRGGGRFEAGPLVTAPRTFPLRQSAALKRTRWAGVRTPRSFWEGLKAGLSLCRVFSQFRTKITWAIGFGLSQEHTSGPARMQTSPSRCTAASVEPKKWNCPSPRRTVCLSGRVRWAELWYKTSALK